MTKRGGEWFWLLSLAVFSFVSTSCGGMAPRRNPRLLEMPSDTPSDPHASLPRESIRRTIRAHIEEVRGCYQRALAEEPDIVGAVVLRAFIGPGGWVHSARVHQSSLLPRGEHADRVASCIEAAAFDWRFDSPTAPGFVQFNYPFHFARHAGEGTPGGS